MSSFLTKISPRQPLNIQSQIAQIKSAGQLTVTPSTQGVPKVVTNVAVRKTILNSTQVQLIVSFTQNPGDPYFTSAKIYMALGNANPVVVGEGAASPLTITVARTKVPATIIVVSSGNWGATVVSNSPVKSISLA